MNKDELKKLIDEIIPTCGEIDCDICDKRHMRLARAINRRQKYRDQQIALAELENLEARSDCAEDQCGLDASLLVDNLLQRIRELEDALKSKQKKI